jgi:hypothetical protein
LRGHRDNGAFSLHEPMHNDGTFRAALRLRLESADGNSKENFMNYQWNASYFSWKIQNEIINAMGQQILHQILEDVKQADFYSILVDETMDVSEIEQLSLSIRYVKDNTVREVFIGFVEVKETTDKRKIRNFCLDLNLLRGQGYDGAANMRGALAGVQAII